MGAKEGKVCLWIRLLRAEHAVQSYGKLSAVLLYRHLWSPTAAAGMILLLARMWDAVNDPLMGMIADRTRSRWGKFRPISYSPDPLRTLCGGCVQHP